MEKQVSKIAVDRKEGDLQENLRRYCEDVLALGATRATIVSTGDIPVDRRITLKCQVPRCFGYGTGAHCPPNTLAPDELRDILKSYAWAVFFTMDVPLEVIVRDRDTIKERVEAYQKMYKMVSEIESRAFYDGHYLAFGFAAGSCRHTFCGQMDTCQAMEGKKCRFSLVSRPSMEAVGIDVYQTVARAGWEIYPIGSGAKPQVIPKGVLAGIVIIQ